MIRVLPLVLLTACATFPQVQAVASKSIGPRPALLTADELTVLLDRTVKVAPVKAAPDSTPDSTDATDDLRGRADALRAR